MIKKVITLILLVFFISCSKQNESDKGFTFSTWTGAGKDFNKKSDVKISISENGLIKNIKDD